MLSHALLHQPQHQVLASADLDHTRTAVGRCMKPHGLSVRGRGQALRARMHHLAMGRVSLSRLHYGAPVQIEPDRLEGFYLVQMPLAGTADVRCGGQHIQSTPELASVLSPQQPVAMQWAADCDQLMVRIERSLVEQTRAARLGHAPAEASAGPPVFQLGLRWRAQPAWACVVNYLADCASHGLDLAAHPLLAAQVEQLVSSALLDSQPHQAGADAAPSNQRALMPRHVRRVQDHLHAHADEPISADQLASLAGVSLRSLYAGFSACLGMGPMHYLRALRLDRARADLQTGRGTVAGVALHWGFAHLGRFSADYRQRFGENPSDTLRKA
ncbi:MAG: transcriptional regulator [Burkholderiales bacterium PBB5]|nr:MAG: transcriptional regulator [Burkholderiales bacterium PBB5]